MKVIIIRTWDEGEFMCESKKGSFDALLANYRKKNSERLRAAGYKQLIPEIREEEMTEEEYQHGHCATCASAMYFNGIGLAEAG